MPTTLFKWKKYHFSWNAYRCISKSEIKEHKQDRPLCSPAGETFETMSNKKELVLQLEQTGPIDEPRW